MNTFFSRLCRLFTARNNAPYHVIIVLALLSLVLVAPGCSMFTPSPRETCGVASTAVVTTSNGMLNIELASGFVVNCSTRQLGRTNSAFSVAFTSDNDKPIINAVVVKWEVADRQAFKSVSEVRNYFGALARSNEPGAADLRNALLFNFSGRSTDVVWENPNTLDVFTLIIEVEENGLVMNGVVGDRIGLAFENDQLIRFGGVQISDWRRRALGVPAPAATPPPVPAAPAPPTASTVTAGVAKPADPVPPAPVVVPTPPPAPAALTPVIPAPERRGAPVDPTPAPAPGATALAAPAPPPVVRSGPTPLPPPPSE